MNASVRISMPNEREVVLERDFDAPPEFVFAALTQPDLLRRWYGPDGWTLDVCEIDLRVGGRWRYVVRKPDGKAVGQRGEYRQIVPAALIVNTESWEDWDPGECLVTTRLDARDGGTAYVCTTLFPSRDVRDTVVKSGLEQGAAQSYARLARLLSTRRASA